MEPQMNADERRYELNSITERIVGCAFRIGRTLGCGFLEKVYENAMVHELVKTGFAVSRQHPLKVYYDSIVVGEYTADILVEGAVLVELKAVSALDAIHLAQCMNYLKATGLHICMLINFGRPKVEVKRIVNQF
jgi:GxxExxY protein